MILSHRGTPLYKGDTFRELGSYFSGSALTFDSQEVATKAAWKVTAEEAQFGTLEHARNLSHTLFISNPLAKGVGQSLRLGVIGSGVSLNSKILNKKKENGKVKLNERANNQIQRDFKRWGKAVTTCGQHTWTEAVRRILTAVIESGECFIKFNDMPSSPDMVEFGLPFSFEIIEGDSCDDTYTQMAAGNGSYWDQGIRLDKWGRPVEYAFKVMVNGRYETKFFDARDILHVFPKGSQRPNSRHGWPLLTPALTSLYNVEKYMKTHLAHAIASAGTLAWVEVPQGYGSNRLTDAEKKALTKPIKGGTVRLLPAGAKVTERGQIPAANLDSYVKATIQLVAITAGLSVEYITGDGSQTNFGSIKAGNQHCHEKFCEYQEFLSGPLDAIFYRWLKAYLLKHTIKSVGSDISLYQWEWDWPDWPVADELKHVNAVAKKREMGLISDTTAAKELNCDYEKEVKQMAADAKLLLESGVTPPNAAPQNTETDPMDTQANTVGSGVAEDAVTNPPPPQ